MSETFIKIDSLQHFEISSQTYPTNGSKILWKTVSKHLNRVLNLFSQMSYNFVYLDPVPGKQTNSKGMRYFGPKVSLTDECVFTVRTLLFVSVLQYSEGYTQFFWCQKKWLCEWSWLQCWCHADEKCSPSHRPKFLKCLAFPLKFGEVANPPVPQDTKR